MVISSISYNIHSNFKTTTEIHTHICICRYICVCIYLYMYIHEQIDGNDTAEMDVTDEVYSSFKTQAAEIKDILSIKKETPDNTDDIE
jgi:hypothetical protein